MLLLGGSLARVRRGQERGMDLGLEKKVIIVTGGAQGIGGGISRVLAQEGVSVVIADYNGDLAKSYAVELAEATGSDVTAVQFDATSEESVHKLFQTVIAERGGVDGLVNNVGGGIAFKSPRDITLEEWNRANTINMTSMFMASREFIVHCEDAGKSGRAVNVISKSAVSSGHKKGFDYATYKAAGIGFTRSISKEVADDGIVFNGIMPGYVATNKTHYDDPTPENEARRLKLPSKQFTKPEDLGNIVAFLLSQKSSQIIGTTLDTTGGLLL